MVPSAVPSNVPSDVPSMIPSELPSMVPSDVPSVIPDPERDALWALYTGANGEGWRDNTNWLSDESICDWYNVYCNSEGHVFVLSLSNNNLDGTIPTEFGLLTSLQYLFVDGNDLEGMIPTEFGLLKSLIINSC